LRLRLRNTVLEEEEFRDPELFDIQVGSEAETPCKVGHGTVWSEAESSTTPPFNGEMPMIMGGNSVSYGNVRIGVVGWGNTEGVDRYKGGKIDMHLRLQYSFVAFMVLTI
jgi:hypothetical protein